MPRSDMVETEGTVIELLNGSKFKVDIGQGDPITCTLSGKLRMHYIRILIGDRVTVSMSPYDLTKGRIIWRHR